MSDALTCVDAFPCHAARSGIKRPEATRTAVGASIERDGAVLAFFPLPSPLLSPPPSPFSPLGLAYQPVPSRRGECVGAEGGEHSPRFPHSLVGHSPSARPARLFASPRPLQFLLLNAPCVPGVEEEEERVIREIEGPKY